MRGVLPFLLAFALIAPLPALAAECSGVPAELAGVAAAWSRPDRPSAALATLAQPMRVTLKASGVAGFAVRDRPEARDGYAGAIAFTAAGAGDHAVVVSQRMWIDVVDAAGKALEPSRVERRLRCDGIAKSLVFTLAPGAYRLQLSEGASPSMRILVAPLD